ncbi:HTH-type transcriptional regulator GltR [Collibacillus ludicampi]|uniref:HTH-type transcriptional regulator GltR n=1 Tax=Collibacillus ludicampi TaxID=2771369 RepID=A0AAV4LDG7_9BACL|nr:LysR family transcriptional regulator [Collibacillus ludicampi]GIM45865.1 HTH-type transcriptional regulator GltR [Collibacillus ludicampi]
MDINDLRIFYAVAKHLSMTKAAEELNYVQSNVTNRIHMLEKEIQAPLFYRHNRGVTLTSVGATLLSYTEKILYLLDEAHKAVMNSADPCGPLSIGASETTLAVRLPRVLNDYLQAYPKVDVSVMTGTTDELIDRVLTYQIDGAFVVGPVEHPAILQKEILKEDLVLIQSSQLQQTCETNLSQKPMIVFARGCTYRALLEQYLRHLGIRPKRIMEFTTIEGILSCVKSGLGVSIVAKSLVKGLENDLTIHPMPAPYSCATTVFIRRHDSYESPALKAFLELVDRHFHSSN